MTKDADDIGVARREHLEDLLRALTGCAGGEEGPQRNGGHEAAYSFSLTPDHSHLSYQKISNGVPVSKKIVESPWHIDVMSYVKETEENQS